ncbi:unnamed protein product [Rotaria magnacalcarata]|uniref:Uncharacterized protein n=2 Tax=Rotaria magnacalcarata TaxID=392030 RepID=A0A816MFW2_9BILA|nr:unnamed protein product [Rotaria magnacalcarata]CAF4810527.1 unnamed protein product [Rotaria magnacalcarata]
MMAIIVRAVELYCGYHPRNIQLIVLAIVLESHSRRKGRLDNISTDEEKSLITAILATAQALISKIVDIARSSEILAIRNAKTVVAKRKCMIGLIENLKKRKELNPGDIIIATNIAGRGIDLSIDKLLEANGGLHVILSCIPGNLCIQQQVLGTTRGA